MKKRAKLKLEDVVEAMDLPHEWESLLDPETGEIVTVTEEERFLFEREEDDRDDLPEWQQESLAKIRGVLDSGRALHLPDAYDVHEWDLMRRFASGLEDPEKRAELLDAIHGTGAFRLFKMTTARLGLRDQWFAYRNEAVRRIARDWLEAHDIPYVERDTGE